MRSADPPVLPAFLAPVIDPVTLNDLYTVAGEDAMTLWLDLVHCYLADSPDLVQMLQTALEGEDRATMRHIAHTLKSSSASIGALPMSRLCAQVEATDDTTPMPQLDHHVEAVLTAFRHLRSGLSQLPTNRA
jgi:HPt (histidine-containing phosphotransfer) domain-containing protein